MDNFVEWLSDNLRYIILGGAVLLIVIVLFFGIRACAGSKKGNSENEKQTTDQNQEDAPSSQTQDGETDDEKTDANPMENASDEVKALITEYYKALGAKDTAALQTLVNGLTPADESKITNAKDYIEGYEVSKVYTKAGKTEGSYVVYAMFNYLCKDITTPVPALSQFYVLTDSEGKLKIDGGAEQDAEISAYTDGLKDDADVQKLTDDVKKQNEDAQIKDPALAEFLAGLGEDASASTNTADGEMLTVTEDCNVRAEADGESEVIGGLSAGTQIEKKGTEGEWIQIDYEGGTAYVHSSLLE